MHLINQGGNETGPLLSVDEQRRLRMMVDYEDNKICFKDKTDEWYTLPATAKGLLLIPLTKEACDRHKTSRTSPPPWTRTKENMARVATVQGADEGRSGKEQCNDPVRRRRAREGTTPEPSNASVDNDDTFLLPPSKGKWIQKEYADLQKQLHVDIAMLLNKNHGETDLVEVFCGSQSMMTTIAQRSGLKAERWTKDDVDLETAEEQPPKGTTRIPTR